MGGKTLSVEQFCDSSGTTVEGTGDVGTITTGDGKISLTYIPT